MSNFKWKDLLKLNSPADSYLSPLSCISHIDMNAFFAQVEQIRCGYTKDDPVVCVQWTSIIAVSYAARKYGISRMDTVSSAMEKCPNLIPIHPAVFKRGEDFWQYHDGYGSWNKDKSKRLSAELYKVSLIPYRREGRKILKIFQEYCDLVEKASVDEVFMDMGRLCFQELLLQQNTGKEEDDENNEISYSVFQEIRDIFVTGRYNLDSTLPAIPESINEKIEFKGNIFTSSQSQQPSIEDWDDVIFALASHVTDRIRCHIEDSLGYTTSCGIARTKTVSKLGSNYKKPNAQTVILNKYMNDFLDCGSFEITSFWTMGGFLGQSLVNLLNIPTKGSIKYIRESWSTAKQLQDHFVAEMKQTNFIPERNKSNFENIDVLSKKIHELVNGEFREGLSSKPVVKSMMSNKNMRGKACNSLVDILSWLEVFCSELTFRVEELEQEFKKVIKPNTVTISMKTAMGEVYRKSGPIIYRSSTFNGQAVLKAASKLAKEFESFYSKKKDIQVYPLINLNICITNFDILDYQKNVMDMFGNQAQVLKVNEEDSKSKSIIRSEVKSVETAENTLSFYCKKCDLKFESNKDFQEHLDFDIAVKLSETLNGVSEDSSNLSIGERRLLFRENVKEPSNSKPKSKRIVKSNSSKGSHPTKNILNFFKK